MKDLKMGDMRDKDKLKKLVQIIGDLLKIEGNEWLIDEMLTVIGENSQVEQIAKNSLIQNIHEYCVEQIIENQASSFYAKFPIQEIKDQLIQDYKKMEHERRRDDFENFCLHMYQQIENISNYLFDRQIQDNWESEKKEIAIKSDYNITLKKYEYPKFGGTTIEELVFQDNDTIWYANRKFRAILFYFYFNREIIRDDYIFNTVYFIEDEIYQVRNKNHRGGKNSTFHEKILNKISGNESKYYFRFYGFLQDFITKLEDNLINSTHSPKPKLMKKSKPTNKTSNTLGDNPKLASKFKKLNDSE